MNGAVIIAGIRHYHLACATKLSVAAAGRVFSSDEAQEFDRCMRVVELCDTQPRVLLSRLAEESATTQRLMWESQQARDSERDRELDARRRAIQTRKRRRADRELPTHHYLGTVTHHADEPITYSTLVGGAVALSGWHADVVPFWEMDEIPSGWRGWNYV